MTEIIVVYEVGFLLTLLAVSTRPAWRAKDFAASLAVALLWPCAVPALLVLWPLKRVG